MVDFSKGAGAGSPMDLIPHGQLAYVVLSYRGAKESKAGGRYLDFEAVIDDGQPFARRKLWPKVGDPEFKGNSEDYRQMGLSAITRILEAGRGAGPSNPAGYQLPGEAPEAYAALDGLRVPVKIKISKGRDGYDDSNDVEFLTPNPASPSHKILQKLQAGQFNVNANAQQPKVQTTIGFGAPALPVAKQPAANSSWVAPPPAANTQQPQATAAPPATSAPPATTSTPPTAGAANPNGWLAQAQQKPAA